MVLFRVCRVLPWVFLFQGCASDSDGTSGACRKLCDQTCVAFEECGFEGVSPACATDCVASFQSADCSDATPPDQYSCDELEEVASCAAHCSAVCARAPECGTFDSKLCLEGCAAAEPIVCNAASVPARSCDELKPEARWYQDVGRSRRSGDGIDGIFSPSSFSLCEDAGDCEGLLACVAATNTCGACSSDADCDRGFSQEYVCSTAGECIEVDCKIDDDCGFGACDGASHTCVECTRDEHCIETTGGLWSACDVEALKCVECTSDEHCSGDSQAPYCDVAEQECVECLSDEQCTEPSLPRCDTSFGFCRP